ncbi:MAG: DUF58 domain-containing protein [Oscillospiraceae bacterium]
MRRNRILYIIMALAFLAFSMAYQSRIASVLLIASLCYPVLAAIGAVTASRFAEVGFVDDRSVHSKGEEFELWIYVRGKSVIPYAPVELQCNLPDRDTGLFSIKRIYAAVPPLGRCRVSVTAMHRYRGSYIAEISRLSVFDPLRIIRITRKISSETTLIFLPRRIDIGELSSEAHSENSVNTVPLLKGEREEFSHVRDYRLGDIMQLVHWKLTAKQDELMIKQYDEETERKTYILCDYTFDAADPCTSMKQADAVIEASIAFALSAVKSGCGAVVDLGSGSPEMRSIVRDMPDFERFYNLMAVIPARMAVMDFAELALQAVRSGASTVLLITCRLTEDTILAAQAAAESFQGEVVLVWLSLGTRSPMEPEAEGKRFVFFPVRGDLAKLAEQKEE